MSSYMMNFPQARERNLAQNSILKRSRIQQRHAQNRKEVVSIVDAARLKMQSKIVSSRFQGCVNIVTHRFRSPRIAAVKAPRKPKKRKEKVPSRGTGLNPSRKESDCCLVKCVRRDFGCNSISLLVTVQDSAVKDSCSKLLFKPEEVV